MAIPKCESRGALKRHNEEQYHPPCPECGSPTIHCPCCREDPGSAWHVCSECKWEEYEDIDGLDEDEIRARGMTHQATM